MFITRVRLDRLDGLPAWVQALPAVRSLYHVPLPLGAVTIVTGDNGAGKSTLMEALAVAMRVNVEGGSRHARFSLAHEKHELGRALVVTRERNPTDVFFVRGETFLHLGLYYASLGGPFTELPELSHGQGLMEVYRERLDDGLVLLDEPEDRLSVFRQLELLGLLWHVVRRGEQVVMATHSPVLMSIPGATLLEVGAHGIVPVDFDEVEAVRAWQEFIADPRGTTRYLLED
ncbi:AAA family ATPase [Corynebacterium cystitidis]|uniref:AAA family ATPase n=1 Tax=Corynebacterium cystitidis TaxID=35757 RepID=UPI00211F0898|nr:AAA family ATPase [Corynebacterium cystitidis]